MNIIKTICLFLFETILVVNCYAQQVTKKEAIQAAINTIRYEKNGDANRMVDTVFTKITKNDTLMYEVVFDDGSIVILSGNKACIPILGIIMIETTDTNNISSVIETDDIFVGGDDVPNGLNDMMEEYEQQISYCFSHNITGYYTRLWQQLQMYDSNNLRSVTIVGPLLTTKWGQSESNDKNIIFRDSYAYNAFVTEGTYYCTKCLAGCAAVAMAQIMKFWDYPEENPQQNLHFDWNNMPDALLTKDNNHYTVEKKAVAELLRNCGKQANMNYCLGNTDYYFSFCNSSAYPDTVFMALKKYGYNDAIFLERSGYSNWISLIINNLNNGTPILYNGYQKNGGGGHSFVCDGYKESFILGGYKFHFNWGWNGRKDGWFVLDKLTPSHYNFSYNHNAIFNLYPTACFSNIIRECDTVYSSGTIKEYAAKDSIRNNGYAYVISNNASIHLQAGEEILLSNGFFAAPGSDFQAIIAPCSSSAPSFPDYSVDDDTGDDPADTFPAPKSLQNKLTDRTDDAVLTVHPNPTDDMLHIGLSNGAIIATAVLYDLQGRTVYSQNSPNSPMNLKSIPAGLYLLRVTDTEGREYQRKVVKR